METQQQQMLVQLFRSERQALHRYACFRTGNAEDADDAVQEALYKLLTYNGDIQNLRAYLYRTVANACTDLIRNQEKARNNEADYLALQDTESAAPKSDNYRAVATALHTLPEEQAEVIRLRFHANMSFAEIADLLQLPLPTVKSRLLYGMEKLRKSLHQKILNHELHRL